MMYIGLHSNNEIDKRIKAGFGMGASFRPFYTVLKGNSSIFRNKGTSLWNFVQTPDFKNFARLHRSST